MNDQHLETLRQLNRNYVRSVEEADVAWFDRHLAADFMNTNPDGSLIDRAAFGAGLSKSMLASYLPAFFAAGAMCLVAAAIVWLIGAKKPAAAVA